jgi:hypothetical protein
MRMPPKMGPRVPPTDKRPVIIDNIRELWCKVGISEHMRVRGHTRFEPR